MKSGFTQGNESTTIPITNANILWGAIAAAALGATLADWQKKREEEESIKRAEAFAHRQEKIAEQNEYNRLNAAYQASLDAKKYASSYTPSQKLESEEENWLKKLNPVYQYELRKEEAQKEVELQKKEMDLFQEGCQLVKLYNFLMTTMSPMIGSRLGVFFSDILNTEPQIGFIKPTDPFDFGNPTPDMNPEIRKTLDEMNI